MMQLAALLFAAFPALSSATVVSTSVAGTQDIYLSGQPAGSTIGSDNTAVNNPTLVGGITLIAGHAITFGATGITAGAGCTSTGADGCGSFSTGPANNFSTYSGPAQALIGLFLGAANPSSTATGVSFTSTSFSTLAPGVGVVFFIGDGLTGHGNGTTQTFIVPTGATRLYLATSDSIGGSFNNSGAFSVAVDDGVVAAAQPGGVVPEPSTVSLFSLGAAGLVMGRRRASGAR